MLRELARTFDDAPPEEHKGFSTASLAAAECGATVGRIGAASCIQAKNGQTGNGDQSSDSGSPFFVWAIGPG